MNYNETKNAIARKIASENVISLRDIRGAFPECNRALVNAMLFDLVRARAICLLPHDCPSQMSAGELENAIFDGERYYIAAAI